MVVGVYTFFEAGRRRVVAGVALRFDEKEGVRGCEMHWDATAIDRRMKGAMDRSLDRYGHLSNCLQRRQIMSRETFRVLGRHSVSNIIFKEQHL